MNQSAKFNFNKTDVKRIGKHLVIVAVAAVCAELLKTIPSMNFGVNQVFIVPVISMVLKGIVTFTEGK